MSDDGAMLAGIKMQTDAQIAQANAARDVALAQSAAQVQIASQNAAVMTLGINKSSQDAQFQTLAWLTERLDANDTKLQIAVENAKIAFRQEGDRHVENMEQLKLDARKMEIDEADRARSGGVSMGMSF